MNIFSEHTTKWLIAAMVLVLIITNTVINVVVAANIESSIEDLNEALEDAGAPPNFIGYDDLSYAFLSATLTLEDVEIDDEEEFDFRAKQVRLKFNKSDFEDIEGLEDLSDLEALEISNLVIGLEGIRLELDDEVEARADRLEFEFKGEISSLDRDPELLVHHLVLVLKEAEIGDDKAYIGMKGMELVLDADEQVNLMELDAMDEAFFADVDNFGLLWKMEGFEAPSILSRELDLDGFGIGSIETEYVALETRKNGDELSMMLELEAEDYGMFDLEASLDFVENQDDPYMDLELRMEDLDRKLYRLFRDTGFESDGDRGYTFEYEGLLSEIEGALGGF